MVPQPEAVDSSAAVIIHALIRDSKQETWVGEIDDLVNERCMAHRKGYSAMTMPPEMPHGHGRRGGAKSPRYGVLTDKRAAKTGWVGTTAYENDGFHGSLTMSGMVY